MLCKRSQTQKNPFVKVYQMKEAKHKRTHEIPAKWIYVERNNSGCFLQGVDYWQGAKGVF